MRAYLSVTDEYELPPHVAAAVDDARVRVDAEFADDPDADLRREVIPAFYRESKASASGLDPEAVHSP